MAASLVDTHVCCCAQFFPEGLHFMTAQLTHVFLMLRSGSRFGYETVNFHNFMACLILVVALMGQKLINAKNLQRDIFTGDHFLIYSIPSNLE